MPDYYAILGVSRDASADDVKRAYRKLARESHPDANPDDAHAEERFKQISEAYEALSDPEKRRRYDTFGDAGVTAGASFGGFGDLGDIMESFFGGSPFGRARTRARTSAVAGQDIGASVTLTLEDVARGARRALALRALALCDRCGGDGCRPGTFRGRCTRCGGQGEIRQTRQTIFGVVATARPCAVCGGAGEAPSVPCDACGGQGRVPRDQEVMVEIPAGVAEGTTLRLRGRGDAGPRGGPDGDLYVHVQVEPHEVFARDGDDLVCELVVPLSQAALGAEIAAPTLDGESPIRLRAGTQSGTVVRLRGRGLPRLDGRGRGDLRAYVTVVIPERLKPEERALFERLAEIRGESAGGAQRGIFRRVRDSWRGE
jgi:molecular chaperone DnaJ